MTPASTGTSTNSTASRERMRPPCRVRVRPGIGRAAARVDAIRGVRHRRATAVPVRCGCPSHPPPGPQDMLDSSAPLFHTARFTDPQQVLEAFFGYREFRPGQRKIIDAVL